MKMLFQGNNGTGEQYITDDQQALKIVRDIETPTYLNLAHGYNKVDQHHYAIKYATQALENEPKNTKALYRRGVAYTKIGEIEKARFDLNDALEYAKTDENERKAILQALNDVKLKEKKDREREKEMSKQMFQFKSAPQQAVSPTDPKIAAAPSSFQETAQEIKEPLIE